MGIHLLPIFCLRPIQNFYCCRSNDEFKQSGFKTNTKFLLLQIELSMWDSACLRPIQNFYCCRSAGSYGFNKPRLRPIQNFYCCRSVVPQTFSRCLRPIQNFYCCRFKTMTATYGFKTNTKFLLLQIYYANFNAAGLRPIQNFYCCRFAENIFINVQFKTNTKFLLLQIYTRFYTFLKFKTNTKFLLLQIFYKLAVN